MHPGLRIRSRVQPGLEGGALLPLRVLLGASGRVSRRQPKERRRRAAPLGRPGRHEVHKSGICHIPSRGLPPERRRRASLGGAPKAAARPGCLPHSRRRWSVVQGAAARAAALLRAPGGDMGRSPGSRGERALGGLRASLLEGLWGTDWLLENHAPCPPHGVLGHPYIPVITAQPAASAAPRGVEWCKPGAGHPARVKGNGRQPREGARRARGPHPSQQRRCEDDADQAGQHAWRRAAHYEARLRPRMWIQRRYRYRRRGGVPMYLLSAKTHAAGSARDCSRSCAAAQ